MQPPTALWTRWAGLASRPDPRPEPSVRVVTPWVAPGARRRGLHRLNTAASALALLRAAARAGRRPVAVVSAQDVDAVVGAVARRLGARLVVLVKDDYSAGADLISVPAERLRAARERTLRQVDDVVVVSPRLRELCAAWGRPAHLVPPGAEVLPGAAPHAAAGAQPRPAVFIGMVSDRIDLGWLRAFAATGRPLVLVGRRQPTFSHDREWAELLALPGVTWTGPLPREEVARHLASASVGLMPYVLSDFNQASFPLKLLEYVAAGLPVVSSRLSAVEWLDAPGVSVVDSVADFAACAARLVDAGGADPELAGRMREWIGAHTWAERGRVWRQVLGTGAGDLAAAVSAAPG